LPIIIRANLKKSTNSYIPKVLQCNKDTLKKQEMIINSVPKTSTNIKKTSESNSTACKVDTNPNNGTKFVQNCNYDIPKALQDFYNEITKEFESTTDESSQTNKNIEETCMLTIDKSVKDSNNLMTIVQKNNILLENMTLKNIIPLYSLESKVILILYPETQFSFLGKLKLKVLYGAVQVYGSILSPQNTEKPVEIYSPRGYSSINILSFYLDDTYNKEALWNALTIEGVDRSLNTKLHDTINVCKQGWSVILLENFENTLTNFLNNYCSFRLFPKVENMKYSWCDPRRAEYILQAHFQFYNSSNEISICPQWNKTIIQQLVNQWNSSKSLCTMIVGGKSVGKSTTARYLINNLLRHSKKVILLDLDPGQAEITPSACLSLSVLDEPLLGPNFTHLKTPFYQLYLEDINVSNCITRYIKCVKKLIECLKSNKDLLEYPVIVNTMGFCKGIGLDICIFLIKLIEPNNIVQIQSNRKKNNFDLTLTKQTINNCVGILMFL
jgi:hypothetical protein